MGFVHASLHVVCAGVTDAQERGVHSVVQQHGIEHPPRHARVPMNAHGRRQP